jgi:hypothetical protein
MQPHSVFEALQLAVSPVILISAYGLLLLSMTNRLGRAIDRARALALESKTNKDVQIGIITQRAKWIRAAILFIAIAVFAAALLVLVLFLSVFVPFEIKGLVSALFILSVASLIASLIYFIVDIFGSLKAMEAELEHIAEAKR